ncbi:hypothetical protein [Staphylococcus shinii]
MHKVTKSIKRINSENNLFAQYTILIDKNIIDNIKTCIENYKVQSPKNKILLSPLTNADEIGDIQDFIGTYVQFMINFGKVIFDEYGIKIVIESEMLNNIQKSIKKQYHSYN